MFFFDVVAGTKDAVRSRRQGLEQQPRQQQTQDCQLARILEGVWHCLARRPAHANPGRDEFDYVWLFDGYLMVQRTTFVVVVVAFVFLRISYRAYYLNALSLTQRPTMSRIKTGTTTMDDLSSVQEQEHDNSKSKVEETASSVGKDKANAEASGAQKGEEGAGVLGGVGNGEGKEQQLAKQLLAEVGAMKENAGRAAIVNKIGKENDDPNHNPLQSLNINVMTNVNILKVALSPRKEVISQKKNERKKHILKQYKYVYFYK